MAYPQTDEDFRSRYSRDTAGMPGDLAAIASKNLAAQDASLDKINAVQRYNSALPGVGTPGSTPQTDAANLSMANAMDRADLGNRFGFDSPQYTQGTDTPTIADLHTDDIAQRRAAIDEQKKQIQARLGIIQPRDAGLAAVVLAGPKERKDLLGNLAVLEHESDNLLREHHYNAVDAARTAHENLARTLHIQSSTGLAKILNGIADIKEPLGSEEHTAAALKLLGSNDPDIAAARGTPGFEKILGPYAQQAKTSAERAARIKEMANQPADQYYSPEALLKDNPGVEYRQDPKTGGYYVALAKSESAKDVPSSVQTRYAKLAATIQKHQEESAAEEAQNRASKQANVPYSKAADFHAAQTELSLLQKQFPGLSGAESTAAPQPSVAPTATPTVTAATPAPPSAANMRGGAPEGATWMVDPQGKKWMVTNDFVDESKQKGWSLVPPQTPSATRSTSAPDLKALALKALNDPNASDEHKAAARKILGQ